MERDLATYAMSKPAHFCFFLYMYKHDFALSCPDSKKSTLTYSSWKMYIHWVILFRSCVLTKERIVPSFS